MNKYLKHFITSLSFPFLLEGRPKDCPLKFADRCKECGAKYGKLLKQKSCDWTPVSEPPKEDSKYFVTLKLMEDLTYVDILSYSHNLYHVDRFDFADEKRPGWYDYDSEYGYYEINNVLAWMPLPETYKAESEDKCKKCEYYRNPDYIRCRDCKAESEDKK